MLNKIHLTEINSTNTYAKENISSLPDKSIVYADKQTAGRGRFTRTWVDLGPENIFMTIVLKPSDNFLPVYSNITQYFAVKLCTVLEMYGTTPRIKWPNDVLVNGKKISGILSETVFHGKKLEGLVIGAGVNLNADEKAVRAIPDRIATALNLEKRKFIDRDLFMERLLDEFFEGYEYFLKNGFSSIIDQYEKYFSLSAGDEITIRVINKDYSGKFSSVNTDGTIKLLTGEGEENFSIGDIL